MAYDTGIASRLRAAGIPVVECSGWQTRGSSSFNPRGAVNHHTAGPASGATPSLNTCINGRPDLAGPLCNVMQSREPDGNDKAYVIAAGTANHAGSGGWRGLSGNSSVYGLEIEHTGTSTLPMNRQQRAAAIHAALIDGRAGADMVCQHREWAPSRKIDAAEDVDPNQFRDMVAQGGGAPRPPEPEQPKDDKVYALVKGDQSSYWWLTDFVQKRHMRDRDEANYFLYVIRANGGICADDGHGGPQVWTQKYLDNIRRTDEEDGGGMVIFTSAGKPQYALSGGKAAGIKNSGDSTTVQSGAGAPVLTLSESTYNEWLAKFRDGDTGA